MIKKIYMICHIILSLLIFGSKVHEMKLSERNDKAIADEVALNDSPQFIVSDEILRSRREIVIMVNPTNCKWSHSFSRTYIYDEHQRDRIKL